MKTITTIILSLLLFATGTFAQNDDNWEEKSYSFDNFSSINIEGGFRIHLIQGDKNKVVVKSPDSDVFDHLHVNNWGDELKIYWSPDKFDIDRVALYITFSQLENLDIEGGVKLYTHGYIDIKDIDIRLSGGAKIDMNLKADDINIIGEGGVLFDLKGIANSLDVKLSGAGHVDAEDLQVKEASINIEGVGTSTVNATDILDVEITGVGKVTYCGNPEITRNIEGFGSVKRKQ